ncbi:MAG: DUF4435 domain-containing protein [Bacteroidota bacterium]
MRKYLDETDKINSIRLQLRHPSGKEKVWILVEGESDQKLFGGLIDAFNARVEQVHGGLISLRKSVETLSDETDQVIGIRDADFLHLEGKTETISSLYLTDCHDAEMMMIASDKTMVSLIAEYLDINEYQPQILRKQILQSIAFLGYARWHNHQFSGELNFKGLSFGRFYDARNYIIHAELCIQIIHQSSPSRKIDLDEKQVQNMQSEDVDLSQLCNGHDFEKALASFITEYSTKGVNNREIGKALRLSYTKQEFLKTELHRVLKSWEDHSPFSLFASTE